MVKHVHLIGIGGSGLSAIAIVLLESGIEVSGSDRHFSPFVSQVQAAGGVVVIGHRAENVAGADLVVRSSAIPDDNVEVLAALENGIPVLKRVDFLGMLTEGKSVVAIAGTHGKTTTTGMVAWMLHQLDLDPSYIIGAVSEDLGSNAHAGKSEIFVIEADEYDGMFLGLTPEIALVTSLEHDHPDCYPTYEDYYQAFKSFAERIREDGVLITCDDDPGAAKLHQHAKVAGIHTRRYGIDHSDYDYFARELTLNEDGGYAFEAVCHSVQGDREVVSVPVSLRIPGKHNVRNALGALAVIDQLGVPLEQAAQALSEFHGTGRRFEIYDTVGGVTLIDDYAHHPTEIRATLEAARKRYPNSMLWAVWQPHTYSRTRTLLDGYKHAFQDADRVLVLEIYAAREAAPEDGFSSQQVVEAIREVHSSCHYAADLTEARNILLKRMGVDDVVIVLSAGDADQLNPMLSKALHKAGGSSPDHLNDPLGERLQDAFGERLRVGVSLSRYTASRIGGPADYLLEARSADELAEMAQLCWEMEAPFMILGGGSNVLISDQELRGVVILNHARAVRFDREASPPTVWAESGVNFGALARQAAALGLGGLAWAGGIPGTLGGAVVGNAGAHGSQLADRLEMAEILQLKQQMGTMMPVREEWSAEKFDFRYRGSVLKVRREGTRAKGLGSPSAVVLSTLLRLEHSTPEAVKARMDEYNTYRRKTQPPGASMGSMFKNPPGDYAGRLIEACGLKGKRIGNAQISTRHANFFVNLGGARAEDVLALIDLARQSVLDKFGIRLELEIELIGDFVTEQSREIGVVR